MVRIRQLFTLDCFRYLQEIFIVILDLAHYWVLLCLCIAMKKGPSEYIIVNVDVLEVAHAQNSFVRERFSREHYCIYRGSQETFTRSK
jgi:hypothetical protein